MLENFRNLAPGVRIIVVAIALSVVAGLLALIPLFLYGGNNNASGPEQTTRPGSSASVSPDTTEDPSDGSIAYSPQPTFTYTQDPKPTKVPAGAEDPGNFKTKLSAKVLRSSYDVLQDVALAYCSYPKGEDKEARAERLSKYFDEGSPYLTSNDNAFITQQKCVVTNGLLISTDGSNGVFYKYSMNVATQYLQSDLSDDSATADLKDYGYSVSARYVNGKWVIDKIDVN